MAETTLAKTQSTFGEKKGLTTFPIILMNQGQTQRDKNTNPGSVMSMVRIRKAL